jgi:hypothetical protein
MSSFLCCRYVYFHIESDVDNSVCQLQLFERTTKKDDDANENHVVAIADQRLILQQHRKALIDEKLPSLRRSFSSSSSSLVREREATLVAVHCHLCRVLERCKQTYDYVERVIEHQLVAALGRQLSSNDFRHYMRDHSRKLFKVRCLYVLLPCNRLYKSIACVRRRRNRLRI